MAQFLYLAIAPTRFFSARTTQRCDYRQWLGRVRPTHKVRRVLEWWLSVPNHHNGRSIYKPIETAYLRADSSDYGWGGVLNGNPNFQARGIYYPSDRLQYITWKELR
jgi:hypothetical protein